MHFHQDFIDWLKKEGHLPFEKLARWEEKINEAYDESTKLRSENEVLKELLKKVNLELGEDGLAAELK